MSYRHPRFYREDYTGFNRGAQAGFTQAYTEVTAYFDKKIEDRKAYEADLHTQADKMREQLTAAKEAGATFQKSIEDQVQLFLKEGLSAEGTDKPGFFAQNIKENRKSKLDLDAANANFNEKIAAANNLIDRTFVQSLEIDEDFDHGSGSYLEYASVVKALQSNFKEGGSMDFNYKGKGSNEFDFGVTINNPRWREGDPEEEKTITYTAEQVQALIGENDPEARKQIEENINASLTTLSNTAKADLEKRNAYGQSVKGTAGNTEGKAYYGETSVRSTVSTFMSEMRQQDENNPDDPSLIDDIFNNKVKFNDKIRIEELERAGGSSLVALTKDENGNVDGDKAEKLAQLLDMPHNEISMSKKILTELGVTDQGEAMKLLEAAKNNMVERYLVNEVMGMGIASKFVPPTTPTGGGDGGGRNNNQGGNFREITIGDQSGRFLELNTDTDKLAGDYSKLNEEKLLPRNVKKNEDGTFDFDVKKGAWWQLGSDYDEDKISEKEFAELLKDPNFKNQYIQSLQDQDYSDLDLTDYDTSTIASLQEGNVTVDGSKKNIYNSDFDRTTGELTLFLSDEANQTSKTQKVYNMRTQTGYMDYYMDRLGYSTQKERNEGFEVAADLMTDELLQNDYNDSFTVDPYEFLEDGPVRDMFTVKKKIQDINLVKSKLAELYKDNPAKQESELQRLLREYSEDTNPHSLVLDEFLRNK